MRALELLFGIMLSMLEQYRLSVASAPTVAKGQVIGMAASFVPGGGFIFAIDLETGKRDLAFFTLQDRWTRWERMEICR